MIQIILAIDTSADDTSAAVTKGQVVLSNCIWSQVELHKEWGGIVPSIAKRAHAENLPKTIDRAIRESGCDWSEIDAVAVTIGPGLSIALEIGIAEAKRLAIQHSKPLIPVNHMEGHLYSAFAVSKNRASNSKHKQLTPTYPFVALLASGGHTELILMPNSNEYLKLAETLDDAVGEAFDKVARMLGLGYPGGYALARLAEEGDANRFSFTEPIQQKTRLAFSYSGLKTAVLREIRALGEENLKKQDIADLAASFQRIAILHLVNKTRQVLELHSPSILVLGGGVARNTQLRKELRRLAKTQQIPFLTPISKKLCQDNAAMIGVAGWYAAQEGRVLTSANQIESIDRDPVLSITQSIG